MKTLRFSRTILLLGLLAAFAAVLSACGSGEPEATPTPVPLTVYDNEEMGFSMSYPETWVVGESSDGAIEFKSGADVNLDTSYTGGGIVQVFTIPNLLGDDPVTTLNSLRDDMIASIKSEDEQAEVKQEPTAVTVNGQSAAKLVVSAQQGTENATAEVYYILGTDMAGLMILVYPSDNEGEFRGLLDSMLNSFELKATEIAAEPTAEPTNTPEPTAEPEPTTEPEPTAEPAAIEPANTTSSTSLNGDVATYTSEEFNLSLSYPADWILSDSDGFIAIAADQDAIDAQTFENTGGLVVVGLADAPFTPVEFLELAGNPSQFIDTAEPITEVESMTINDQDAASITYQGTADGQDVIAKFTAIANGTNIAFVVSIFDPAVEEELSPTLDEITNSIVIEAPASGSSQEPATTMSLPVPEDATNVTSIGTADAPAMNFSTGMNTQEVAEYYREYAAAQGWTEREVTSIVNDDLVNLVFDGPDNGMAFVVQAFPLTDDSVNVNIRFEDI